MGLHDVVSAERLHIGFFGMRNAGKSSLLNAVTDQEIAVVSDVKGATINIQDEESASRKMKDAIAELIS